MKVEKATEDFGAALIKALLVVGVIGIFNLIYLIVLSEAFNLDLARVLTNLTFAYSIISLYPIFIIVLGIKIYNYGERRPSKKLYIIFPILLLLILVGIHIAFESVPPSAEYALAGLLCSFSVLFGLFAALVSIYVFHKEYYGRPLFDKLQA